MKSNNILYAISLILLVGSIFLIVQYPESGRFNMMAGGLVLSGLVLNFVSFTKKSNLAGK